MSSIKAANQEPKKPRRGKVMQEDNYIKVELGILIDKKVLKSKYSS